MPKPSTEINLFAHSPGPWQKSERPGEARFTIHAHGKFIASTFHDGTVEEDEANAELLRLSPEMRSALQDVWDQIPYHVDPSGMFLVELTQSQVQKIRIALGRI